MHWRRVANRLTWKNSLSITKWATIFSILLYPILNICMEVLGITSGPRLHDYGTYYYAVERLFSHQPLHTNSIPSVPYAADNQYVYPTITILLFVPFAVLPLIASGILFNIFSLIVLAFGACYQITQIKHTIKKSQIWILAWCVIGYSPIITGIKAGQVTVLVGGGLCLIAGLLTHRNHKFSNTLSSVLTVVIVSYKLYFIPLSAHLLTDKKRIRIAAVTGVILVSANIIIFGLETTLAYIQYVVMPWLEKTTTIHTIQWRADVFQPWFIFGTVGSYIKGIILITVAILAYEYRDKGELSLFYLGLSIVPLASPRINVLNLVALLPIYVHYLGGVWWGYRKQTLGFLSLFLVQIHPYTMEFLGKFGPQYFPSLSKLKPILPIVQPALWGTLILFVLLVDETVSIPKELPISKKSEVGG